MLEVPSSAHPGGKKDPLSSARIRAAAIVATRGMPAETPLSIEEIAVLIGSRAGALRQQRYCGRLPIKLRQVGRELRGTLGDVREIYFGISRNGGAS